MNWSLRDEVAKELFLEFRINREFNCEQACKKAGEEADYFIEHVANSNKPAAYPENFKLPKTRGCPDCFGSGGKRDSKCRKCKGSGKITI